MARGTARGSIIKRELEGGRVRWDVRVPMVDPATGKRSQPKETYATQKEAKTRLTAWLAEIDRGVAVQRSSKTLGELLDFWLENYVRPQRSGNTYSAYESGVRLHIIPRLGRVPVQKLTLARLQAFFTELGNAGCGVRTVELCHTYIRQALDRAIDLGWVGRNVATVAKPPRWKRREMETWSADEARRFLAVCDRSTHGPLWILALATGLRRGELLGLRWSDIDYERRVIRVCQTVTPGGEGWRVVVKPPKGNKRREVDISAYALSALLTHRVWQNERRLALGAGWTDMDLVFTSRNGTPLNPDNVDRDFNSLIVEAGVKKIRIHDCRHTYATLAISAGKAANVVAESLGHADVATTLRVYAHVTPSQRVDLAETIDALLFRPISGAL